MAQFLAPIINDQQEDANGNPLSGGTIEVYLAGSATVATTYSDKAGAVPNTSPITLNTLGVNSQGAVWLVGGVAYKFIIKNAAGVTQRTIDNVSGINDSAVTNDQWVVYLAAPTYVSATSFTVAGDQTQTFQVGRRVKTTNTGGTISSTITASVYSSPNTTVTVRNDSGVLDSGLSAVSYGLISVQNSALTGVLINTRYITATATYTPTAGTTFIIATVVGGGGGGGGSAATGAAQVAVGAGGGAGGWAKKRITAAFSGVTATVGAGGAGASGASGANGGTTSLGALLSATGGAGGVLGSAVSSSISYVASPTSGGVGASGDINGVGGIGVGGFVASGGVHSSGAGGSSVMGGGAPPVFGTSAGNSAGSYGAGASGSAIPASGGAATGGTGFQGIIIIEEYA